MNWVLLAGSLAGVLGLAAAAWLLGLGGAKLESEREAMEIAEAELPGFRAGSAWLSLDRQSAVVFGADGSVGAIRRHGAQFIARRLIRPTFRQVDEFKYGGRIEIDCNEEGSIILHLENRWDATELSRALAAAEQMSVTEHD